MGFICSLLLIKEGEEGVSSMRRMLENLLKSRLLDNGIFYPSQLCNASCLNIALQVRILSHTFCQSVSSRKATGLVISLRPGVRVG